MRHGRFYTHERFMDVIFMAVRPRWYGKKLKVTCHWYNKRGFDLRTETKHELTPEKALEFKELWPYELGEDFEI